MYLIAIGLIFMMALPSVDWSLLIVTFSYLTVDISLHWAVVHMMLMSLGLRKIYLTKKYFGYRFY